MPLLLHRALSGITNGYTNGEWYPIPQGREVSGALCILPEDGAPWRPAALNGQMSHGRNSNIIWGYNEVHLNMNNKTYRFLRSNIRQTQLGNLI